MDCGAMFRETMIDASPPTTHMLFAQPFNNMDEKVFWTPDVKKKTVLKSVNKRLIRDGFSHFGLY